MKIVRTETQVWKLDNEICITHFLSETRQLFETVKGSFVYLLDEDRLYKFNIDNYTKLLIKLICFTDYLIYDTN